MNFGQVIENTCDGVYLFAGLRLLVMNSFTVTFQGYVHALSTSLLLNFFKYLINVTYKSKNHTYIFSFLKKTNANLRSSHWRCSYVGGDLRYDVNLLRVYLRWGQFLINLRPNGL